MRFLSLFSRKQASPQQQAEPVSPTNCSHLVLTPRWDSVGDIGHEERAVGYRCASCSASLTPEEASDVRRFHARGS